MNKEKTWTENQMNIFSSYFHGMIFILSILLLFEIPMMLIEGDLLIRLSIICLTIPFLTYFNVIMFINLKIIWMREFALVSNPAVGDKN